MNFKKFFLTLSIKNQICITIISLNIFCILVIFTIYGSLAYEILREDFHQKKLYFYDRFKEYIESCFFYQNFCLLQYEEIIKRIQLQLWEHLRVNTIYDFEVNINIDDNKLSIVPYKPMNISENNSIIKNDNDILFYSCYDPQSYSCFIIYNKLLKQYNTLSSLFSCQDINDNLRIPMYGDIQIKEAPLFIEIYNCTLYSFNSIKVYQKLNEFFGIKKNEAILKIIQKYIDEVFLNFLIDINKKVIFSLLEPPPLIELIFNKSINKIKEEYSSMLYIFSEPLMEDIEIFYIIISSNFPNIDYINNKLNMFVYVVEGFLEEDTNYLLIESKIIDNYLYFINNKLSGFLDIYFIPLFYENDTIISPDLCFLFLLKQLEFQIDENKINELYEKIIKGKSFIQKCFSNENILNNQSEIKHIFNLNLSYFLNISINNIYQGIINLQNIPYYYVKYSYPNYNSLKDFKSDYFSLDQINFYLFASFKEPIKYSNFLFQILLNCFFLMILIIFYIWIFCLFINLLIFYNIIKQLIEPIKNLQKTIESNSIKNDNIFKYEYDDFIDELFSTCKELLTGQIAKSNDENLLENFNILSLPKDKQKNFSENKYINNLIINNEIINNLINQKKSLMDFSENIKLNEYENKKNNNNEKRNFGYPIDNINNINNIENSNINNIIENKNNNKYIEKEREDKEPYKKLFQISQYLYYYQNKNIINYININNNIDNKDNKISEINEFDDYKIEKVNSNLIKSMKTVKSNMANNNNENISINMINNKNISYLWYMEAKKKNNKSFNYNIGNNYDELFMDSFSLNNE